MFTRQEYQDLRGEMEKNLADIWRDSLKINRISRSDIFFELGGPSLLVMNFVNRAKQHEMHIDTRGVISFPVLKDLAEQITKRSKRFYFCDTAIPVRQYGNETSLFLLPDGGGDIPHAFELARDIDKNIPVYVLPWPSPEDEQPTSIERMAKAIIPLIESVQPNGPCVLAGYSRGGVLAYEISKQLLNAKYPASFLGLIPILLSETEMFLTLLHAKFPARKIFNDSK